MHGTCVRVEWRWSWRVAFKRWTWQLESVIAVLLYFRVLLGEDQVYR
jgi:hypothetical protein